MSCKKRKRFPDSTRIIDVIGIQPADDLSRCCANAFVDSMSLSFILFGNPAQTGFIFFKNRKSFIRTPSIHYHILGIAEILRKHALYCTLNIATLIERGGNDRKTHRHVALSVKEAASKKTFQYSRAICSALLNCAARCLPRSTSCATSFSSFSRTEIASTIV